MLQGELALHLSKWMLQWQCHDGSNLKACVVALPLNTHTPSEKSSENCVKKWRFQSVHKAFPSFFWHHSDHYSLYIPKLAFNFNSEQEPPPLTSAPIFTKHQGLSVSSFFPQNPFHFTLLPLCHLSADRCQFSMAFMKPCFPGMLNRPAEMSKVSMLKLHSIEIE